ncbi:MAG: cyclodeaminase/cyclohydrolase family protein [Candidatus Omnitrophica bacterium]|nr:cyclodeaminase/cyclohydrolase family protein [Candidatus Omnitrophota bacterium]
MKNYTNLTLKEYISELSSAKSVPGGGSSSAVVALNGVALLIMSAKFSIDKQKDKNKINAVIKKLEAIKKELEELVTEDAKVYLQLMEVCKLHKNEKMGKAKINKALKKCASVPEKIAELSNKAFETSLFLIENGNVNLLTDISCAMLFLSSAFSAAKYNVLINIKYIGDTASKRKKEILTVLENKIVQDREKFLEKINKIIFN